MTTVACIHTAAPLIDLFRRLAAAKAPQLKMLQLLDEPLLQRIRDRGRIEATDVERLASHIRAAREAGASAILVTCSTLSPCVDELPEDIRSGVFKVDDPLMRVAVARGGKIVIAATNAATLEPSAEALRRAGATAETALIAEAFDAFVRADLDTHDRLLIAGLVDLAQRADTIVLAQASMARIVDRLPEPIRAKVLSSPELAIEALLNVS